MKKHKKIRIIFDITNWLWKSDFGLFWPSIIKWIKGQNFFMAVFLDLWSCLFTNKLFKRGHASTQAEANNLVSKWGTLTYLINEQPRLLIFELLPPLLVYFYVIKAFFSCNKKKFCPQYSLIPSCAFIR
jgi:hypothetical protein